MIIKFLMENYVLKTSSKSKLIYYEGNITQLVGQQKYE